MAIVICFHQVMTMPKKPHGQHLRLRPAPGDQGTKWEWRTRPIISLWQQPYFKRLGMERGSRGHPLVDHIRDHSSRLSKWPWRVTVACIIHKDQCDLWWKESSERQLSQHLSCTCSSCWGPDETSVKLIWQHAFVGPKHPKVYLKGVHEMRQA